MVGEYQDLMALTDKMLEAGNLEKLYNLENELEKMGDWQTYADQVVNRFDYETNDWAITNVCSGAAIYGQDGTLWANSGTEGGDLTTYQHPLEGMGGDITNVEVNEVACAMGAADGNRQPSQAGIRMGKGKYMLTYKDDELAIAQLTRSGGGAVVGKTTTAVVIGFWKKDQVDSNSRPQNMEDCRGLVQEMCSYLIE